MSSRRVGRYRAVSSAVRPVAASVRSPSGKRKVSIGVPKKGDVQIQSRGGLTGCCNLFGIRVLKDEDDGEQVVPGDGCDEVVGAFGGRQVGRIAQEDGQEGVGRRVVVVRQGR